MAHIFTVVHTYAPDDPRVIYGAVSASKAGHYITLMGTARQVNRHVPTEQIVNGVLVTIVPVIDNVKTLLKGISSLITGRLPQTKFASATHRTNVMSFLFVNLWVIRVGIGLKIDVVHCHDLTPLWGAWVLARLKRAKFIYDVHENVVTMYQGRKGQLIASLERFLLKRTDWVISAGWRLEKALKERGAKQISLIGNWKNLNDYNSIPKTSLEAKRTEMGIPLEAVVITFIGTLDTNREILPLLEAISTHPATHLIIGGRGVLAENVQQYAEKHPNVHWLGWVSLTDVPLYTCLSDALYLCLDPVIFDENDLQPAANKLFESFASGVPLIARSKGHEASSIMREEGVGILLDDVSIQTLHKVFESLKDRTTLADLRERTRLLGLRYNWAEAEKRLLHIYESLSKSSS